MRKKIAHKWIKALRSGKYKQGKNWLKSTCEDVVRHCCLGVLCELHNEAMRKQKRKTAKENFNGSNFVIFDGNAQALPPSVQKWAGMKSDQGEFPYRGKSSHPGLGSLANCHMVESLAGMNDGGCSFQEIATFITKNTERL